MSDRLDGEVSQAAERYAQAAFDLALEQGGIDALASDMDKIAKAFELSADLRQAAASPLIDPAEKTRAFVAVAKAQQISALGCNVIGLATQNRRAAELPAIAKVFAKLAAIHKGQRQVEIVSAKPLTDAEQKEILAALKKSFAADVSATVRVDESLIGGFVVRAGSRQFDASLRTKLDGLRLALKSA